MGDSKRPHRVAAILARLTIAAAALVFSGQTMAESLGGRPFAPPGHLVPMPQSWTERGVSHATPEPVDLAISLDQQLYPSFGPIIAAYAKEHGLKIAIQEGTCGISASGLAEKTVDMGGFCCPPGDLDRLPGLTYHTIGIGSMALIVNPANPVDDVSMDQARSLFAGTTRDWAELPMSGFKADTKQTVQAVTRLHCKVRPGHWRILLDNQDQFGFEIIEVGAIPDMIRQVASLPLAVGYETLWHIQRLRDLGQVKALRINGIDPRDAASLATGKYPLYRVFNLAIWSEGPAYSEQSAKLVEHLLEKAGSIDPAFGIVSHDQLRQNGWKFAGDELVGEPAN